MSVKDVVVPKVHVGGRSGARPRNDQRRRHQEELARQDDDVSRPLPPVLAPVGSEGGDQLLTPAANGGSCQHRWLVASQSVEGGDHFRARCKRCGATRTFDADGGRFVPGYGRPAKVIQQARREMRDDIKAAEA